METALRDAYDHCRRMQRRHDPTYYWATRRLPADVRPATHALYGYVRIADELVDGPRRAADPETRIAALDAWEAQLHAPEHPVALALLDAAARHDLPLGELEQYMGSMRADCGPIRMQSWTELDDYMDGSAGTVGRIMAVLLGATDREAFGRMYLPVEAPGDDHLRATVQEGVQRARSTFAGCEGAVAGAPARVRPGIRIALGVYGRVLDRIEAVGFDVMGRRTAAPPWQVAAATLGALRA